MTNYTLVKSTTPKGANEYIGGNSIVAKFEHFSTAMKALRATDESHFIQGSRQAWWYDEAVKRDAEREKLVAARAELQVSIVQSLPTDDQIILEHMKKSVDILTDVIDGRERWVN